MHIYDWMGYSFRMLLWLRGKHGGDRKSSLDQNFLLDCACSEIIATEIHLVQFIILCIGGMGEEHNINAS